MTRHKFFKVCLYALILACLSYGTAYPEDIKEKGKGQDECFESREGYTVVKRKEIEEGEFNIKCSDFTGAVLWWGDPFEGTVPLGEMPLPRKLIPEQDAIFHDIYLDADYYRGEAVVKARTPHIKYYMPCTVCHNGVTVKVPENLSPRFIKMHTDIVPDSLRLKHGHGAMWCLDCHSATNRDMLIDHRGGEISFDQPQKVCGKCHGEIYRDWRSGIHGKRTGMWTTDGKKRWWVCTECHNPHDVEFLPFKQIAPELAPEPPRGSIKVEH
jgi:uncharacterized CHY-type Zn-finger protein